MNDRVVKYVEENNILPSFQFGFLKGRNIAGAVGLLKEIVQTRLNMKKRTYVAFIDMKKAFDSMDRSRLLSKLQVLGIPVTKAKNKLLKSYAH